MIERVEVLAIAPESDRYSWASDLAEQYMLTNIVRIFDADGFEGNGAAAAYSTGQFDLSIFETLRPLAPRLLGRDPGLREQIWFDLHDLNLPLAPGARSALDIALWDLTAKRANLPLYQLLGGARTELRAYASTPLLANPDAYVEYVGQLLAQGFRAIKFHAWCEPERDLAMLRAVHHAYEGSGVSFMHDAEQRYDRESAFRVGRELEEMEFAWFEAPLSDFDLDGYRELRSRVSVPIIPSGNWILDTQHMSHSLQAGAWDAMRFDATVAGGITPARKLVALAEASGMRSELQSWGLTFIQAPNLHLGLGLRGTGWFELPVPSEAYAFGVENPFWINADGNILPPTEPGLSLQIDWQTVEEAAVARFECGAGASEK